MEQTFQKSQELLERARKVSPLGSQTYSKSYRYFIEGQSPSFLERGLGCYVWDVDGNRFIDFICALGPVTVGYCNEQINQAIIRQLEKGISFSQAVDLEVILAEKLTQIIPCAEMVRFVKNGSDATSAAIRLARAFTGRDFVAVSGYHGMQDWYIGSTPNNRGIPQPVRDLTVSFEYNNLEALKQVFERHPNQVAAVILEPIQGDGPLPGYLEGVRALASEYGAILVFDEVVSGFRYALGGASEYYGVVPDLAAFGKGMGNGLPISAVAGRKEILELIETQRVFVSTTFGGEALSLAGSLETLRILEQPGTYEKIWKLGEQMLDGIRKHIATYGLGHVVKPSGLAPHGGVTFEGAGSLDYLDINSVYQQRMIREGILTLGINNISLAHSEAEISRFTDAFERALQDIAQALEKDSLDGLLLGGKVNPVFKRNIR